MRNGWLLAVGAVLLANVFTPNAHRDSCHRWHSCPSDHKTYECGDLGYCGQCPDNAYCKDHQPKRKTEKK
jgi:hypothetical protein